MKICPACSNTYSDDANFCPMDANRLVPAPVAAPAPTTTEKDAARSLANRYVLGELLAKTSTGEVYSATDGQTGDSVRVKVIDQKALPTAMMADRALREFKQLAKVKSDKIVKVLDQGKAEDGRIFVVTESLAGRSLEEVVAAEGALPFDKAKTIVASIGEALTEAQKVGVIHRDVAPRNIVQADGKWKLGDFGVAEPVTDRIYGTPAFLSPEQAEGKPVDQRSNIYSLGALLYFALTGGPPFDGERDTLIQQHLNSAPKPPSQRRAGLGADVDKVVLKALEKSGGRRHLTLRQLLNEVEALPVPSGLSSGASTRSEAKTVIEAPVSAAARPSEPAASIADALGAPTVPMTAIKPEFDIPAGATVGVQGVVPPPAASPANGKPAKAEPTPTPVAKPAMPAVVIKQPEPAPVVAEAGPASVEPSARAEKQQGKGQQQGKGKSKTKDQPAARQPEAQAKGPQPQAKAAPPAATVKVEAPAKQPEPLKPIPAKEPVKPQPAAVNPGQPTVRQPAVAAAPAAQAVGPGGKKKFRETAWFKKGELEEEMAKRAASETNPDDPLAGPAQIEAHVDESALTADDRARLSLKTGRTEAMPVIKPSSVPGERMSDEEMLSEVDSGRKWIVVGAAGLGLIALAVFIYFMFLKH